MTDTKFYDDMFGLAQELMNQFGTPCTLRHVEVGEVGADGKATKTTTDTPGLAVRLTNLEVFQNMELKGNIGYVVKVPVASSRGDLIIHAGRTFEILDTKTINPEGDRLMISFHGTKEA